MKQVLIIDESPQLREYLRTKLEENGIEVTVGKSTTDGISKMRVLAPDLIILDYQLSRQGFIEILRQKKTCVNTVNTPVIVLAGQIDQKQLIELIPYNVKKVFNKPVKVDAVLTTISEILGLSMSIDESPSIMEVHVNDNIIFIEIAKGLNRDKLDLLRFKITELVELYDIRVPKIIIMFSDMKLSFADAPNMQKLLNTVLQASKAKMRYIRLLTKDDFIRQLIQGRKEYSEMEVVSSLNDAMEGLLTLGGDGMEHAGKKAEILGDRVLQAKTRESGESNETMVMKFDAEAKNASFELMKNSMHSSRIAVIDDDPVIHEIIKHTFQATGASIYTYNDGEEFLEVVDKMIYDLAFLDLNMPGKDGFQVLTALQARNIPYPVIILSAIYQREAMIRAIQMGVKSYLIKPLKPEDILRKSIEILKTSF